MTITDEMVEKARDTVEEAHGWSISAVHMRGILEAIAPMLIAQGMREAANMMGGAEDMHVESYQHDIRKRAQELDPR